MSRIIKTAAIAAASIAAVAVTATPALAWTNGPFTASASSLTVKVNGTNVANCTGSTLTGSMTSSGTFSVTGATATGCGVSVTPTGFPWSGSFSGGTATITGFRMTAVGCTYTGSLSGPYTGAQPPATATFTDRPVSGSGFLCFSGVTVSATYTFTQ